MTTATWMGAPALQVRMTETDMTQQQLAIAVGTSQQAVGRWLGGTTPRIRYWDKIEKTLNIHPVVRAPITMPDFKGLALLHYKHHLSFNCAGIKTRAASCLTKAYAAHARHEAERSHRSAS